MESRTGDDRSIELFGGAPATPDCEILDLALRSADALTQPIPRFSPLYPTP